jgi:hypothetical protein
LVHNFNGIQKSMYVSPANGKIQSLALVYLKRKMHPVGCTIVIK